VVIYKPNFINTGVLLPVDTRHNCQATDEKGS
jgi:hypothetical protein